jgi:UTP--glucose-1-phosphate uridylyltransferase
MKVRKAVIIAAGWGTRFLPVTRSIPKEMLPLVDKPLIQYAVEEALDSGIRQIIIVTARGKTSMEDYFDRSIELENFLEKKGNQERLRQVQELSRMADVCYVRQKEQLGLGHAILTARDAVGDEPFAVILPDDLYDSKVPAIKQMLAVYNKYQAGVVAVGRVPESEISRFGVIKPKKITESVSEVLDLVEKPPLAQAPSNLAVVGRYIFMPQIFDVIAVTPPGKGNEIQITDAMQLLLKQQKLYACEIDGVWHAPGTPLDWLKANIAYALKRDDIGPELREYLKKLY